MVASKKGPDGPSRITANNTNRSVVNLVVRVVVGIATGQDEDYGAANDYEAAYNNRTHRDW
jgi:hypothetical protein